MTEAIGWTSSLILLVTIVRQVCKQYRDGSSEGVSKWMFVGQLAASAGFAVYSLLIGSWVFVVTNTLMGLSAAAGLVIMIVHKSRSSPA